MIRHVLPCSSTLCLISVFSFYRFYPSLHPLSTSPHIKQSFPGSPVSKHKYLFAEQSLVTDTSFYKQLSTSRELVSFPRVLCSLSVDSLWDGQGSMLVSGCQMPSFLHFILPSLCLFLSGVTHTFQLITIAPALGHSV